MQLLGPTMRIQLSPFYAMHGFPDVSGDQFFLHEHHGMRTSRGSVFPHVLRFFMRGISTKSGGEEQHPTAKVMLGISTYLDLHLTRSWLEFIGVDATILSQLNPILRIIQSLLYKPDNGNPPSYVDETPFGNVKVFQPAMFGSVPRYPQTLLGVTYSRINF